MQLRFAGYSLSMNKPMLQVTLYKNVGNGTPAPLIQEGGTIEETYSGRKPTTDLLPTPTPHAS